MKKAGKKGKIRTSWLWERAQQAERALYTFISLFLSLSDSLFPSLGSLRRNNSSSGSSSVDPWLTVASLLWETGSVLREVGKGGWDPSREGGERWRNHMPFLPPFFLESGCQQTSVRGGRTRSPPVEGWKKSVCVMWVSVMCHDNCALLGLQA